MATPSIPITVMLAIQEKKTNSVDLYKPIRHYISEHYSERNAVENEDDLHAVQQMRNEVEKASNSLEARRDLLQRYYKALCMMESRFPISNEKQHVNSIYFTWFDAFKPNKKASNQNIHFEKASVLFNLGAVQSQIALAADRATENGIKQACNCFQAAAGAFAFLRDNISMKASVSNSTVDISIECAGMLERLMLAQAQECFFDKAISDKKPPSLCSKLSRQVGLFYEEAHAALSLPPLSQHLDKTWIGHVQLKAAQYHGEACYRLALDLHDKENIAEEIARLSVASNVLSTAKRSGRGVVSHLLDAVSRLEVNVNHNLEQANKENDRVYLMRVPPVDSLAPLPAVSLVKPLNMADVLDASKEKMFIGLVPDSSAKALSRYTEMVDDIIRTLTEKLQQESEVARVRLKEMDLPDMLYALDGHAVIPEHLKEDIEAVQLDGGPSTLEAEMTRLQDMRQVNVQLLAQCEEILQNESREDAQLRTQFGTRWSRPQSSTLTKSLHDSINSFNTKLKQAADVDARIDRMIRDNWEMMNILSVKPIESTLPNIGKPIMSLNGNEDAIIGALKQSMGQLEMLGSQRAGLEDMLKEMKRKDDILPKLMTTSGSYEDLFKKELGKYDQIQQELQKNIDAQEKILQQIKMQNDAYIAVFNIEDYKVACDRVYSRIRAAISKYRDIRDSINNAGLKFYVSLQDAVSNLKQQCGDYVMTREIQGREMVEDLQRQMSNLSVNNGPGNEAGSWLSRFPFLSGRRQSSPPKDGQTLPNVNSSESNQVLRPPYYSSGQGHEMPPVSSDQSQNASQPQHSHSSSIPSNPTFGSGPYQAPYPPYYSQPGQATNAAYYSQAPSFPNQSFGQPQGQPAYIPQVNQVPPPAYYSQSNTTADFALRQGQSTNPPYYSQTVQNSNPEQNLGQPPYPGWQGPYYNAQSMGANSQPH